MVDGSGTVSSYRIALGGRDGDPWEAGVGSTRVDKQAGGSRGIGTMRMKEAGNGGLENARAE
jgi:hypothetical protein